MISQVTAWLDEHLGDTTVRTQYLAYLMKLPDTEFEKQRRQAAEDTARWLETHLEDTNVRTQYLAYLMKLPDKEFEEERRQAAKDTAGWLEAHPQATDVRTQYLAYLMKLPDKEFEEKSGGRRPRTRHDGSKRISRTRTSEPSTWRT